MNLRKILLYSHLVTGLVAAIVLFGLGLTGGILVFENEIDHALNSKLVRVQPQGERLSLNALTKKLEDANPGSKVTTFILPTDDNIAYNVSLRGGPKGKNLNIYVNPYTGEVLGNVSDANIWMRKVHQFHTNLTIGEKGKLVTLWGAIFLVILSLTGIVLWWPQKLFTMKPTASGSRKNFELHNVAGFWSSIFMLLFALTGIIIHYDDSATKLVNRLAGVPEPPAIPKPAPPAKGAVALNPDELAAVALKTAPGAHITAIMGFGTTRNTVRIAMKYPEDRTPLGRTNLYLDPTTGEVLFAQTSRTAVPGIRIVKLWNREIHTGDLFGWPTRLLACAASLTLPLLAITGPLIWWGKLRRKK